MNDRFSQPKHFPTLELICRVGGHFTIVLICLFLPAVGDARFLIAGVVGLFVIPILLFTGIYYKRDGYGWQDQFLDLTTLVVFSFIVPEHWFTILLLGVVVAQAPSLNLEPRSSLVYSLGYTFLLIGLSISATVNSVEGWLVPVLVLSLVCPIVIFYTYWQMQKANALRDKASAHESLMLVAGGVAHDFNNILTGISGYSEIAMSHTDPSSKAYQPLQSVVEATGRAALLTKQLLSFAGRQVTEKAPLDLNQELALITHLAESIVDPQITITIDPSSDSSVVLGDRGQLQQVLLNVIINAAEASTLPAVIRVSTSSPNEQSVQVKVIDEGAGIEKSELEKIFDPFFTTKPRGHGLGLAAVKKIIEFHDGDIELDSTAGRGTTVCITLPVIHDYAPVEQVSDTRQSSNNTLLIADDEESIRQLMVAVMIGAGFKVIEAADRAECLRQFDQFQDEILAVILDLKMPGLDGCQCKQEIRKKRPLLPVLIVSGYNPNELGKIDEDANTAFLAKPFRVSQLEDALAGLLNRKLTVNSE